MNEAIPYNSNPHFNNWIDNNDQNIVEVAGYYFSPSLVLHTISPDQYMELFQGYLNDDDATFDFVRLEFPTFVAYPLCASQDTDNKLTDRITFLKLASEFLIDVLFALIVGESIRRALPFERTGLDLDKFLSNDPSEKLLIIKFLYQFCTSEKIPLLFSKVLPWEMCEKYTEDFSAVIEKYKSFEILNEINAQTFYDSTLTEFLGLLRHVRGLSELKFIRYFSHENPKQPVFDTFIGNEIKENKEVVLLKDNSLEMFPELFSGNLMYASYNGDIVCVSPFLHFGQHDGGYSYIGTLFEAFPDRIQLRSIKDGQFYFLSDEYLIDKISIFLPKNKELTENILFTNIKAFVGKSLNHVNYEQFLELFGEGDMDSTFNYLFSISNNNDEMREELILQKGRFKKVEKDHNKGIIAYSEYSYHFNAIRQAVLEIAKSYIKNEHS